MDREEQLNWAKASGFGLQHLKEGLEQFVDDEMKQLQMTFLKDIKSDPEMAVCSDCTSANVFPCPTYGICNLRKRGRCNYHDKTNPSMTSKKCPNDICERLYGKIVNIHRQTPSWKNTDASQWSKNHWEIAKCFLPIGAYAHTCSSAQTDCRGLLHIIINCPYVQKNIQTLVCPPRDIFSKVLERANANHHSTTTRMTEVEAREDIDDMITILQDRKKLSSDRRAQIAVRKLMQLKNETFVSTTSLQVIPDSIEKKMMPSMIASYVQLCATCERTENNYIRLHVVGARGIGKTTLSKRLLGHPVDLNVTNTSWAYLPVFPVSFDVSTSVIEKNVASKAGVQEQSETNNRHLFSKHLKIWEISTNLIYSVHFLFQNENTVYLLVFDLSNWNSIESSVDKFCKMWLFLINHTSVAKPPIILVGTNQDKMVECEIDKSIDMYFSQVRNLLKGTPLIDHVQPRHFAIDNTLDTLSNSDLDNLRQYIISVSLERELVEREPANWIMLENKLIEISKDKAYITLDEVCNIDSQNEFPIFDKEQIQLFLKYHHIRGDFLYFNDNEVVILDQQWLIDAMWCFVSSAARIEKMEYSVMSFLRTGFIDCDVLKNVWRCNKLVEKAEDEDTLMRSLRKLQVMSKVSTFEIESNTVTELDVCFVVDFLSIRRRTPCFIKHVLIDQYPGTKTRLLLKTKHEFVCKNIYRHVTAVALEKWPLVFIQGYYLIYEGISVYKLDSTHIGIIQYMDTAIAIQVMNIKSSSIDGRIGDRLRRFVTVFFNHTFGRYDSERENQFSVCVGCSLTSSIEDNVSIGLESLEMDGSVPCPVHTDHCIKLSTVRKEWFSDKTCHEQIETFEQGAMSSLSHQMLIHEANTVAMALGSEWRPLGQALGLTGSSIVSIRMTTPQNLEVQIFHMLNTWIQQNGNNATVGVLLQQLRAVRSIAMRCNWDLIKNMIEQF